MAKKKTARPRLDISAPPSMRRAGKLTGVLLCAFLIGLAYLAYTLVTQSSYYMAKSGSVPYGIVYDRDGDVLFDGTKPLESYPAGQFADVGNFIGDTSGQMTNTLVSQNIADLANYSFTYGSSHGNSSLQTTLSHRANRAVYQAFGQKNGTVIAYNWKTGELLVCVSKPCVDIAKGYSGLATMPEGSLLCKAFYPLVPGSTQKVSTLIAAYESLGVEKVNALQYTCQGKWLNAKGQQINCHEAKGHGTELLADAFANSCNPYFAQLVQSSGMPLSAIVETYTRMGYGINGKTAEPFDMDGIHIAAASTELKDIQDFDTQWGCLGQGKTLVSPYQLMLWQGAIANGTGKAVFPYLLSSKTSAGGKTTRLRTVKQTDALFSAQAAKAVQDVMSQNAQNHYTVSLGKYSCGVKSGTAQVTDKGKSYENSLLTGFCLDEKCPVAFCIVIENRVNGEITTAQIAKVLLDSLSS